MLVLPGLDQMINCGNTGCRNRAAVKSIDQIGVCLEPTFPYIGNNVLDVPREYPAYDEAKAHQIETYIDLTLNDRGVTMTAYLYK